MATRLEAADRVTLLMSIVPYLISHNPSSVDDVALTFKITSDQVRELISMLASSGVPGETGTYQHDDLFDINWDAFLDEGIIELWQHVGISASPRFSAREAATLVAGLQYVSGIIAETERPALEALMAKIAAGASAQPENILIAAVAPPVDVSLIEEAVARGKRLEFTYSSASGTAQQRSVDPLRLDLVGQTWYLRGFSHERDALRTFRLDRIRNLTVSDLDVVHPVNSVELPDELFTVSDSDVVAVCAIDEDALSLITDYQAEVIGPHSSDQVRVRIRFGDISGVTRLVALYPGIITVLEPVEAVNAVTTWVESISLSS